MDLGEEEMSFGAMMITHGEIRATETASEMAAAVLMTVMVARMEHEQIRVTETASEMVAAVLMIAKAMRPQRRGDKGLQDVFQGATKHPLYGVPRQR